MFLIVAVIFLQVMLFRSRWGLRTRAVGEHPKAADTVGIDVIRTRYRSVILGGAFAGLAGAYLTLEQFNSFQDNMTGGVGFIALAAMIFGRWTPLGAYGAALLFGTAQSMQLAVRISPPTGDLGAIISEIPPQIFGMLAVHLHDHRLAGVVGRAIPPAADGIPYDKEARCRVRTTSPPRIAAARRADERDRAAAFLDLQEGRGPVPVLDDAAIEVVLRATRRIAVVGASSDTVAPVVQRVPLPAQPGPRLRAGQPERARRSSGSRPSGRLAEAVDATGPVDMVDVFRRSELCAPHAEEAVAVGRALPVAAARRRQLGRGPDRGGWRALGA